MVSPLKKYSKDPMGKGRGAGEYYKRGYKGKVWYSKYSQEQDEKRNTSESPYRDYKYRHAGDNKSYLQGSLVIRKKKV